jgi:hypothetical protein
MSNYYAPMLAELVQRRDALLAELKGLTTAIAAISPLASGESPEAPLGWMHAPAPPRESQPSDGPSPNPKPLSRQPVPDRYHRISVRWAALWHMAEYAPGPMRNGEIADAIVAGGYQSNAGSFPNAVSAVLFQMREKGEVEGNSETGYSLTPKGRQTWALIKQGAKFREAISHVSNEQSLLPVQ